MKNLDLVFVASDNLNEVPFTTSDVIAQYSGNTHHAIQQLILKYESDFREFGQLAFEMRAVKRPGERGTKYIKVYHLNEEQATLLLTYLKNTPTVRAFKKKLVHQFYAMRDILLQQAVARESRKPIRRELTDAIRDCLPESPHKRFAYKNYRDLAYRAALGMTAAQLRKDRGLQKKANLAEYLTEEETEAVKRMEGKISVLVESGLPYSEVQEIVLTHLALK